MVKSNKEFDYEPPPPPMPFTYPPPHPHTLITPPPPAAHCYKILRLPKNPQYNLIRPSELINLGTKFFNFLFAWTKK